MVGGGGHGASNRGGGSSYCLCSSTPLIFPLLPASSPVDPGADVLLTDVAEVMPLLKRNYENNVSPAALRGEKTIRNVFVCGGGGGLGAANHGSVSEGVSLGTECVVCWHM